MAEIDNDPAISPLIMDRSRPLGNSTDRFNRQALHTKVGNKPDEPIPFTTILGVPTNFHGRTVSTPGVEQVLVNQTVPVGKLWLISHVDVACSRFGKVTLTKQIAGVGPEIFLGGGRTSSANTKFHKRWENEYLSAGDKIRLKYEGQTGQASVDLDHSLHMGEITV